MNLKHLAFRFLTVMAVVAVMFTHLACEDTATIDSTPFVIHYSGMTDIGPSMSGIISSPTYKGAAPRDFAIINVKLNDALFTGDCFVIDTNTGAISIINTVDAPVGLYKLSISCSSNGKRYEYADIVEVNMMKPVPDGITVEPHALQVEYADVIDAMSEVELPTAQVSTDGNHVTITKYEIVKTETSKFFAITSTGEISVVKGSKDILPGVYTLSLKLTTGATGDEDGIFENAITFNITSKPLDLTYNPATGKIEEESAQSGNTIFASNAPSLKGSLEGLTYAIKSITPATDKIIIDPNTGVLSVNANHELVAGVKYVVDVRVANAFATAGVDFDGVFELEVVEYIEPISNFSYPDVEEIQTVEFEVSLNPAFKGDEVKFDFVDLPAALQGQLSVTVDGLIQAAKGNSIPLGTHIIKVRATNPKSDPAHPTIASFTLTITENPYYFTYIRYGNNLGLTPAANYANQFRMATGSSLSGLMPETDATVELAYEISGIHQGGSIKINASTGEVSMTANSAPQCAIGMITAIAGKGTKGEVRVKTPIFFHFNSQIADPASSDKVEILYAPFAMQVNPRNGGRTAVPVLKGVSDYSKFVMDWRRTFNYYNFNGTHVSGQPGTAGTFMQHLWDSYAASIGSSPNYGAKAPLSYFDNTKAGTSLTNALAYVDADYSVVVNPNKWVQDGEYANGCMIGQITFSSNAANVNNGGQSFPIILWLDTNF